VRVTDGHAGVKGSRVVWLGDRDRIVTTGVSCSRLSIYEADQAVQQDVGPSIGFVGYFQLNQFEHGICRY